MCALLVGLPGGTVVGVGEWPSSLRIAITTSPSRPSCCAQPAWRHDTREVVLVDLPVFGRPARLAWCKQRWKCPVCGRTWTEQHPQIASARCALTTRAARWATRQVGRHGRSVQRLTMARERLTGEQHDRLTGLLRAGDPRREVWFAWLANTIVGPISKEDGYTPLGVLQRVVSTALRDG